MPRVPHLPPSLLCVLLLTSAACAREGGGGDVRRDSAAVDSTAERTAAGAVPRLGALTPDSLDVDTLPDEVPGWRITRSFSFGGVRLRMPSATREMRRDSTSVEWGGFGPCAGECRLKLSIERGRADIDSLAQGWRALEARWRPSGGGPVERVTLGGHPALRGPSMCTDCNDVDYIVPGDSVVARFTISIANTGGSEGDAALARFHRALDTFAWDTAAAATAPPSPAAPPSAQ